MTTINFLGKLMLLIAIPTIAIVIGYHYGEPLAYADNVNLLVSLIVLTNLWEIKDGLEK